MAVLEDLGVLDPDEVERDDLGVCSLCRRNEPEPFEVLCSYCLDPARADDYRTSRTSAADDRVLQLTGRWARGELEQRAAPTTRALRPLGRPRVTTPWQALEILGARRGV